MTIILRNAIKILILIGGDCTRFYSPTTCVQNWALKGLTRTARHHILGSFIDHWRGTTLQSTDWRLYCFNFGVLILIELTDKLSKGPFASWKILWIKNVQFVLTTGYALFPFFFLIKALFLVSLLPKMQKIIKYLENSQSWSLRVSDEAILESLIQIDYWQT